MATFKRATITEKGKNLISRALANETKISFTKVESTDFLYSDTIDITKVLLIDNPVQSVNISEITRKNERITLRIIFSNENVSNTYKINALGVYAEDDNNNEILFALLVSDNPDTIEKKQGQTATAVTIDLIFELSDATNVNLEVNNNAVTTVQMFNSFKTNVEKNYIKNTDYATEQKSGIAKIYSETESESVADKVKEVVKAGNGDTQEVVNERPTGETVWSKLIKTLDHTKILTVRGLVKILSKFLKPATENDYGLVNFQTIKQVSPKPDLSPYMRWDKGYRNGNNSDYVIRANLSEAWTPNVLHMYNANGAYMGTFHTNGGRAYYKVPNRAGGGWCEIMDNHDMVARDNRMNNMDSDRNNIRNLAQDAWNKSNDAQLNRVANMRLAGYYQGSPGSLEARERQGYVVTGLVGNAASGQLGQIHTVQMRALQFQYGNGTWLNTPHV